MEVLQMFRRKAEKRIVELSPDEVRLMREALFAFRNKLLSAGKPTEDVNEPIIKKWTELDNVRRYVNFFEEHRSEFL